MHAEMAHRPVRGTVALRRDPPPVSEWRAVGLLIAISVAFFRSFLIANDHPGSFSSLTSVIAAAFFRWLPTESWRLSFTGSVVRDHD